MSREMKDSGIEWIGEIPEDWKISQIGQMYVERREKVSDKDFIPLSVTMNGILLQLSSAAKTEAHDDRKLVKQGDFVINSRSAAISIIGGADGPTSIFLAGKLQQTAIMGPIAVAAYSYMSLVPVTRDRYQPHR